MTGHLHTRGGGVGSDSWGKKIEKGFLG